MTVRKFMLKKFPTNKWMDCPIAQHHWETIQEYADAYHESKVKNISLNPVVMPSLPRTEADIEKEINRLINDDSNFISDNYGSEAANNGEYEVYFSKYSTEETLKRFAKWLLGNEA